MEYISTIILIVLVIALVFTLDNPGLIKAKMIIMLSILIYFVVDTIIAGFEYNNLFKNLFLMILYLSMFYKTYKNEYLKK